LRWGAGRVCSRPVPSSNLGISTGRQNATTRCSS